MPGKRLTDRAEIIQRRLEDDPPSSFRSVSQACFGFSLPQEEQELLRKRRAQMQRRGDSVERDERDFEQCLSGSGVECCSVRGVAVTQGAARAVGEAAAGWNLPRKVPEPSYVSDADLGAAAGPT